MDNVWAGVSEYDRFGPWIDEVDTLEDMPPLYRDYPVEYDAAHLVLKVPRNIPRRDATPDMDLYNHVLILEQTSLTILSRHPSGPAANSTPAAERGYDVHVLPHTDVVAIHDVATLLDGRLTISTSGGVSITVPYNAAVRAKISTLVDGLQDAISKQPPSELGAALHALALQQAAFTDFANVAATDQLLVSDFLDARRSNPQLRTWASHGRKRVKPLGDGLKGGARRFAHALSPMTVHGAVFSADATALEIFGRRAWLVRGKSPVHSSARLVMPLSAIDRLEIQPNENYSNVTMISIHAGSWSTEIAVPSDCAASRLLSAVAQGR